MASKRKRRRRQARMEARKQVKDKEKEVSITTGRVWKDYKVAVQKKGTDTMNVFVIREHDEANLLPFIARIQEVDSVQDLAHLDVHLQLANGSVQIIYESSPEWPKGVRVNRNEGFIVRGRERPLTVKATASSSVKNKTTVTTPAVVKYALPHGVHVLPLRRYDICEMTLTKLH